MPRGATFFNVLSCTVLLPYWCGALPNDDTRTKVEPRIIMRYCKYSITPWDEVVSSDFHRTKVGIRTKGHRTNAGPRLLLFNSPRTIMRYCKYSITLRDEVVSRDFHRTKVGIRTKGHRTYAGPRLLLFNSCCRTATCSSTP